MLVQKLNLDDLQFEKGTFDGTMAYAQNKVSFTSQGEQQRERKYNKNKSGRVGGEEVCANILL